MKEFDADFNDFKNRFMTLFNDRFSRKFQKHLNVAI